jgi:hypothetical protein
MLLFRLVHRSTPVLLAAGLALAAVSPPTDATAAPGQGRTLQAPQKTMKPFGSERELIAFLKKRQQPVRPRGQYPTSASLPPPPPSPPPSPAPAAAPEASAASDSASSITNMQEAGVDEGGIVKMKGDLLIVLRRGRVFTVSTRDGDLKPIDSIDAYPPGVSPSGDWYDEMLVTGDRVIVIGYSYARGGTEINRFQLGSDGSLSYEDSYHLRSNDYYSSRNYASRLIGTRLIVYTPLDLPYNAAENMNWLPALKRFRGTGSPGTFEPTTSAVNIYLPPAVLKDTSMPSDLHTVTECDLSAWRLRCKSTGVLGPSGRTFYVSSSAVYVWLNAPWREDQARGEPSGLLYRMPLDGAAPSAIAVRGMPTDQFSFREDWNEGFLNVLVRSNGAGDAMWMPEFASGAMSLLQVPLRAFNDGQTEAGRASYRLLPQAEGRSWALQNRFVGDYVLYGRGAGWDTNTATSTLVVAGVRNGSVSVIPLQHGVDRIEAMGRDAVVVGGDGRDLHFRAIELTDGPVPHIGDRYTMAGASQGETRSHAFFFKPDAGYDQNDRSAGIMGLPVTRAGRPGYGQLVENAAGIVFVRRAARQFSALGELGASQSGIVDDGCRASCVDWYGNSRPIFIGNRTFALMGYELVEGSVSREAIREIRRVSFAPVRGRPAN